MTLGEHTYFISAAESSARAAIFSAPFFRALPSTDARRAINSPRATGARSFRMKESQQLLGTAQHPYSSPKWLSIPSRGPRLRFQFESNFASRATLPALLHLCYIVLYIHSKSGNFSEFLSHILRVAGRGRSVVRLVSSQKQNRGALQFFKKGASLAVGQTDSTGTISGRSGEQ